MSGPRQPSPWILRFAPLVARGEPVLDVAAGAGRHTRLFLERGHPVTAVDVDTAGLADLDGRAGPEVIAADLEDGSPWPLAGRRFAAVVVTNYLWRPLFPDLLAAVAGGGVLLCETFAQGNEAWGRPARPAFLLRAGELIDLVHPHLQIVAYEHGYVSRPRSAVVQRICAVRSEQPVPLCLD